MRIPYNILDFQHLAKFYPAKDLLCKALTDTIVTISNITFFPSINQNIKMLCDSRYKLIKNSELVYTYFFFR